MSSVSFSQLGFAVSPCMVSSWFLPRDLSPAHSLHQPSPLRCAFSRSVVSRLTPFGLPRTLTHRLLNVAIGVCIWKLERGKFQIGRAHA